MSEMLDVRWNILIWIRGKLLFSEDRDHEFLIGRVFDLVMNQHFFFWVYPTKLLFIIHQLSIIC